jgi:hypothetical protein
MQVLTVEGVKAAAREYYDRGMLLAQYPKLDLKKGSCVYRGPEGYRCAVGAAMDDATINVISHEENSNKFTVLLRAPLSPISVPDLETENQIIIIQNRHDEWLGLLKVNGINNNAEAEQRFLDAIDYKPKEIVTHVEESQVPKIIEKVLEDA